MITRTMQGVEIRVEQVSFNPRLVSFKKGRGTTNLALGTNYLLKDVSFAISRGDRVAIVGSSGAGKTTLLRLLNRLIEPTKGAIYLGNQLLGQIPVIQLRQQVVLVLQESKLLGMTVQQTLEYPLVLRRLGKSAIQQRVGEWIERLHIPSDWLERTELQLSLGQRQWVAIARALIIQPRVLLLDEPTSALDMGKGEFLIKTLVEFAQNYGATVLMVNHQLDLAEQFCHRVFHLHQGLLMEDLPKEQMNWENLRKSLLQAETQRVEEWG